MNTLENSTAQAGDQYSEGKVQGYEIVIAITEPGGITVNGQSAQDFDQALQMAQAIYSSDGETEIVDREMDDAMQGYGRGGLRGVPVSQVLRDER